LIDKVWSAKNLARSLQKVVAKGGSAGIDKQSARAVQEHPEQTIQKLEQELRAGQYQPQAVKRVWIPKPGSQEKRPLGVPTVRDRIVQGAVLQVIEPADGKVLSLIEGMLQAGVMDSVEGWQATGQGSPQGAVISPLLSNIYLNGLDWKMARKGFEMVRYADDCAPRARDREDELEVVRNCTTDEG
jgi:RNA-directed DNA polymerase